MKDRNVIKNLIWSYIIVWLPVLMVCLVISEYTLYNFKKKEEEKIQKQVEQMLLNMVEEYEKCYANGVSLSNTRELRPDTFFDTDMSRYVGSTILRNIRQYNMDVNDIYIYYGGNEIYSAKGLSKVSVYFEKNLGCSAKGMETAIKMLEDQGGVHYLDTVSGNGYLCYSIPISNSDQKKQSVAFVYSADHFLELLKLHCDDGIAELQFIANSVLCLYRDGEQLEIQKYQNTLYEDGLREIKVPLEYQRNGNLIIRYRTDISFEDIERIKSLNYIAIILGSLVSIGLTIFLSGKKASRIKTLEKAFENGSQIQDYQDEYQYLRTLIRNVVQESDKLLTNENIYKQTILQQSARLIFVGGIDSEEEIAVFLRMSGVELCEEYYCVCAFMTSKKSKGLCSTIIGDLSYSQEVEKGIIYYSLIELPNWDLGKKLREQFVKEKVVALKNLNAGNVLVAISRVYDDITKAHSGYEEVSRLIQDETWTMSAAVEKEDEVRFCSDSREWEVKCAKGSKENRIADSSCKTDENVLDQERFAEILSYIDENYSDCNLTAEHVANHVNLNKTYLSRLFKQKMNISYMDYLTNIRMNHVKILLEETDKSVADICNEVGYIDVSSFRRKFKKIFGVSVSEYRGMMREK
ncbi:MAG: helix-turn-helix transcriptional regulator [Lachnospiraceae bacterium]|nr:helix-turn-helix transcriptional regulator [Lachnospiraceae bacterium]